MITVFGQLTIPAGAAPAVQISATELKVAKLSFQVTPSSTGNAKIGGPGLTNDTTTPGQWLAPGSSVNPDGSNAPGGSASWESYDNRNVIDVSEYHVHGTHEGDLVDYSYSLHV